MSSVGSYLLLGLTAVLAEVVVLILIAALGRGRARRIGLVGAVILLIGAVLSGLLSIGAPYLFSRLDLPIALYSLINLPITLCHGIGVIVIAVAVGTHSREAAGHPPRRTP